MAQAPTVAVFGAGSFGTALALQLANNGQNVRLWGHKSEHIQSLQNDRENRQYLAGIQFPDNLQPVVSLDDCLDGCEHVLIVIPSKAFRPFLQLLKPIINKDLPVFWASKGFEMESGKLLHELVDEELPGQTGGVLSGPTFAREVAQGLPAAVTCAGFNEDSTERFSALMHGNHFRCYTSSDVIGVELGGALKNVLAIAVGTATVSVLVQILERH